MCERGALLKHLAAYKRMMSSLTRLPRCHLKVTLAFHYRRHEIGVFSKIHSVNGIGKASDGAAGCRAMQKRVALIIRGSRSV